jgi:hypothetical protein
LLRIESPDLTDEWVSRLEAEPAAVRRSVFRRGRAIAIIAEGEHDNLIVHGDAIREHFADRVIQIEDQFFP